LGACRRSENGCTGKIWKNLDGDDYPECKDVTIEANGLLFSGEHQLEVRLAAVEAVA